MSNQLISHIQQITKEWLTSVLTQSGALTQGTVSSFELNMGRGNWSTSAKIGVQYGVGAQGSLPAKLFLKMVQIDLEDESFGSSEVDYYTRDYVGLAGAPLIRCYDAVFSEKEQRYHLLLDDLSETHIEAGQKVPALSYGLALAEGLATLHAHWWGEQRLAQAQAPIHSPEHIRQFIAIAQPGVAHILNRFSAELKPEWIQLLPSLYTQHPKALIQRTHNPNGFTLIHGDVGQQNILVPQKGDHPLYIIDRQPFNWSLTSWLGVYDLVYAMVLDWEIETRRKLEIPILQHYHHWLIQKGVQAYSWEQLLEDYRLCVVITVYVATEYCRGGVNERWIPVWLPMLQKSLTACEDWRCSQFW